ncbi:hypothetical protein WJX84_004843, partial [Apatococcus fuscideae]
VLGVLIALLYSGCARTSSKGAPSSSTTSLDPEALRAGGITLLPPNNSTLVFSAAPSNGVGAAWAPNQSEDSASTPLLQGHDVEQGGGNSGRHS